MPIYEKPLKGTEPTEDEIAQAPVQEVEDAAPAQFGSSSVFSRAQSDQDTAKAPENDD